MQKDQRGLRVASCGDVRHQILVSTNVRPIRVLGLRWRIFQLGRRLTRTSVDVPTRLLRNRKRQAHRCEPLPGR